MVNKISKKLKKKNRIRPCFTCVTLASALQEAFQEWDF